MHPHMTLQTRAPESGGIPVRDLGESKMEAGLPREGNSASVRENSGPLEGNSEPDVLFSGGDNSGAQLLSELARNWKR